MRVLFVEDDNKLAKLIKKLLLINKYVVDHVEDGKIAEQKALENNYDVIILDLTLPSRDGVKVCKAIRKNEINTPVLMLTGRSGPNDRVVGLDSGADDYLIKPFDPDELLARIRALLRRPQNALPSKLVVEDLVLDPASHTVSRGKKSIDLMPKEYSLLEFLMRRANQAVTKTELLSHVWGVYSHSSSNRLEVYIRYLREKVDEPFETNLINTVRSVGYRLGNG